MNVINNIKRKLRDIGRRSTDWATLSPTARSERTRSRYQIHVVYQVLIGFQSRTLEFQRQRALYCRAREEAFPRWSYCVAISAFPPLLSKAKREKGNKCA